MLSLQMHQARGPLSHVPSSFVTPITTPNQQGEITLMITMIFQMIDDKLKTHKTLIPIERGEVLEPYAKKMLKVSEDLSPLFAEEIVVC